MRAPQFWTREQPSLQAALLAPIASLWGAIAARKMERARPPAQIPVLCVGNFVVGGAGKTPVAARVCEILDRLGLAPAILSRGYGGALSGKKPVRVDLDRHGAKEVGDEPALLARIATVVIGSDRQASCALACALGAGAVVMDDGFQSAPFKTASLIVVDAQIGVGNGRVLPAGPLRAPLSTQWKFASALFLLGEGSPGDCLAQQARARGLPVFRGVLRPDLAEGQKLAGQRVLAFAGLGRPEKFYETLAATGAQIVARRSFPDHHFYTQADMRDLARAAKAAGADRLVTTEKDYVRLPAGKSADATEPAISALPVSVQIAEEAAFSDWLSRILRPGGSRRASP